MWKHLLKMMVLRRGKSIFLIAIVASIIVWGSFTAGLFTGTERFLEDQLFSSRPIQKDLVIVSIDDESLQRLGQWPWPRSFFAQALENLKKTNPQTVAIDVIFAEPSRLGNGDDLRLSETLKNISYPVILPVEIKNNNYFLKTLPRFIASNNVSLGHVNLIIDNDGVARFFYPLFGDLSSLAYQAVQKTDSEKIIIGQFPMRIVYSGPPKSVRQIPFWRVYENDLGADFQNKIIYMGVTASDLHDEQMTPMSSGQAMAGVEIQAQIANMLLSGYSLNPLPPLPIFFWIAISALLPAIFFALFPSSLKPLLLSALSGIVSLLLIFFLFDGGYIANLVHIEGAWILSAGAIFAYRYFVVEKEKREIRKVFSKYVSKDVLEEILRDSSKVVLGGQEKEVTVFFSDIRGFTSHSEKIKPKELVRILNLYFTAMSREIIEAGGVLDKYIGDAIMAFWGAPLNDDNQADHALEASIKMIKKLKKLNEELLANGDPEINIGIGLYTGMAVVGNIGSEDRFDYTVIGDTVNIASRLEGLNKEFKTNIIIGEPTKNKLKGGYNFRPLGSVQVKGRSEPLNIYAIEL